MGIMGSEGTIKGCVYSDIFFAWRSYVRSLTGQGKRKTVLGALGLILEKLTKKREGL